jgi:hypothetical protein
MRDHPVDHRYQIREWTQSSSGGIGGYGMHFDVAYLRLDIVLAECAVEKQVSCVLHVGVISVAGKVQRDSALASVRLRCEPHLRWVHAIGAELND